MVSGSGPPLGQLFDGFDPRAIQTLMNSPELLMRSVRGLIHAGLLAQAFKEIEGDRFQGFDHSVGVG